MPRKKTRRNREGSYIWLFTRYGFFSVSIEEGMAIVRARCRRHLEMLLKRFWTEFSPDIIETTKTEYRFRIALKQEHWASLALTLASEQTWCDFGAEAIRYGNTKLAEDALYFDVLHTVRALTKQYQQVVQELEKA